MRELTEKNFGIAIAYVIPGFVVLWGASYHSPTVSGWVGSDGASIGSFLYVLLGSLAAGLLISALRWATIDSLHHATGVTSPSLDFSSLQNKLDSFVLIVEGNYRYYQYYANMFVAILVLGICRLSAFGNLGGLGIWTVGLTVVTSMLSSSNLASSAERTGVLPRLTT